MPYSDKVILRDAQEAAIPQYFDPVKDDFKPLYGSDGASLVSTLRLPWRHDFPGSSLDSTEWSVLTQGSGQTITVSGSALQISAGTTASAATKIRSVRSFTVPFRVWFIFYLSQRIANQSFYLELVDSTEQHYAQFWFDGTSATTAKYYTANAGTSGGTTLTTLSSASYAIAEIEVFPDEVYFVSRYTDSTSAKSYVNCRTRLIPDPNNDYYIQIRAVNSSSAPASNTTLYLDAVVVQDISELTVEITGGRGGGGSSQSVPVYTVNWPTVYTRDYLVYYTDSTTALGASATFTGTARDTGSTGYYNKFRAQAYADQAGTLYIEQSRDSSTWRVSATVSVGAGETKQVDVLIYTRYVRVRYVNGGTAQGAFELLSALVGIGAS